MLGCRFLDGTEFGNLLSFRSQKSKRSGNSLRCRSVCLNLPFNNRMTSQNPFGQPVRFLRTAQLSADRLRQQPVRASTVYTLCLATQDWAVSPAHQRRFHCHAF